MTMFFILLLPAVFLGSALFQLHPDNLQAFDKNGREMDCQKCHTLTNQEVKEILKNLKIPEAEILKVQLSPVQGLWEVSFVNQGRPGVLYMDFAKTFLLPGPVIDIKSGKNRTQERLAKLEENRRVDFSKIPLNQGLVLGDGIAPQKVAVFTDPDCPFCEKLHKEMEKVLQERKDIAFYIILYPLRSHKDAYWKSKSIFCNKSLKMLEDAYAHKEIPHLECDAKEIDANIKLAEALGITGTPSLVMSNGRVHIGTLPADQLIDLIQRNR